MSAWTAEVPSKRAVERSDVTGVTGGGTRLKGTQVGGSEVATGRSDGWSPKRTTTGEPRTIPPTPDSVRAENGGRPGQAGCGVLREGRPDAPSAP